MTDEEYQEFARGFDAVVTAFKTWSELMVVYADTMKRLAEQQMTRLTDAERAALKQKLEDIYRGPRKKPKLIGPIAMFFLRLTAKWRAW
jgi:hypothetical protein